jgi:alkylhydroperoxidase/carboxymuconolactone decarboxylase family protein YurZ
VHAHARKALEAGVSAEALRQVAAVAVPVLGLHASLDALRWIEEIIDEAAPSDVEGR